MRHIITFSGGKDSLATIIWAEQNLEPHEYDIVFCDTDWESEETYKHIDEVEAISGKRFRRLKHSPFPITDLERAAIRAIFSKDNIFAEMVVHKGRFPSTKARFCTEELKVKPMIDYILGTFMDVTIVQGVRADESIARSNMKEKDDYFKFYFEPYKHDKNGKALFHTYEKKAVFLRAEVHDTNVLRPILKMTANEVFVSIYASGKYTPNPLYRVGNSRVGCWPCVMCQQGEVKIMSDMKSVRLDQIDKLEEMTGSTFFGPGYIPERFCTKTALVHLYVEDLLNDKKKLYNPARYNKIMESPLIEKFTDEDGDVYVIQKMKVPTVKDVIKYVSGNPDQKSLFEPITGGGVYLSVQHLRKVAS